MLFSDYSSRPKFLTDKIKHEKYEINLMNKLITFVSDLLYGTSANVTHLYIIDIFHT